MGFIAPDLPVVAIGGCAVRADRHHTMRGGCAACQAWGRRQTVERRYPAAPGASRFTGGIKGARARIGRNHSRTADLLRCRMILGGQGS